MLLRSFYHLDLLQGDLYNIGLPIVTIDFCDFYFYYFILDW